MGNTHGIADMAKELQATTQDLLPACIVSTTFPAVPAPPSLTLAAFATAGYVRDGVDLVYCAQEAHTVVLTGGDGTYWVGLTQDSWTTYATWNRTAGTQYVWKPSATRPPDVDGLLVFASCTVSGGNITAVTPAPGVTRAEALRALAGLGTLATQNANAVAITGGSAAGLASVTSDLGFLQTLAVQGNPGGADALTVFPGSATVNRLGVGITAAAEGAGALRVNGSFGLNGPIMGSVRQAIYYNKSAEYGMMVRPSGADGGAGYAIGFQNVAGTSVGSINTTATATAYNTSSDARLKHAIATLSGALDVVQALRPVAFRWNADLSPGVGFLAHELQQTIPEAVTGEPDAVDAQGHIVPQQIDHSKLVPWLTAACQDLAAQVQTLTARLATLEEGLGR